MRESNMLELVGSMLGFQQLLTLAWIPVYWFHSV